MIFNHDSYTIPYTSTTFVPPIDLIDSKKGSSVIVTNVDKDNALLLIVGLIMLVGTSYGILSPDGALVNVHLIFTIVGCIIYSFTVISGKFPALLVSPNVALFSLKSGITPPIIL